MIGKRFGQLVVTGLSPNTSGKRKRLMYYCDCDCGNTNVEVVGEKLRNGHTKSCGCLKIKKAKETHKKFNTYYFKNDIGTGLTSNTNKEFYFDLEDFDKIKQYSWYETQNNYIAAYMEKNVIVYMHRILMDAKSDEIVDHKNHKKNDNRKCNLRIGNKSNNAMNAHIRSDNTSGTTGVCFNKRDDGWDAYIHIDGKKLFIGTFDEITDAIKERHKAEEKYFKEWSYMNSVGKYNNETNELNNGEEAS